MQRYTETGLPFSTEPQGFVFGASVKTPTTEQYTEVSKMIPGGFTFNYSVPTENTIPTTKAPSVGPFVFGGVLGAGTHPPTPITTNASSTGPFVFGGSFGGLSQSKPIQSQTEQNLPETYQGACVGIQHPFGFDKKKDNSTTIKALYEELTVIRTQIDHLTKATDNIYKIISQLQ